MKTKSSFRNCWLASLTLLTALLALPFGARAATYTATGSAELFSSGTGWSAKPVSAATTTIYLNSSGTGKLITNDVAGFLLNSFQWAAGAWTTYGNGSLEFTNNGALGPTITNVSAGNNITLNWPLQFDDTVTFDQAGTANIGCAGVISGVGGIIKNAANTLTLSGTNANTYSGVTTINAGKIALNKSPNVNAIPGNVTIGNGSAPAILSLSTNGQIADTTILTFNGTGANAGVFMLNNQYDTIGGLASTGGAGIVENNGSTTSRPLTLNVNGADQSFDGILQDSDGSGTKTLALTKSGSNAQILTGVNTYTGATIINAGSLTLSGSGAINGTSSVNVYSNATFNILSSGFTVNSGVQLMGDGLVTGGTVINNGVLASYNGVTALGTFTMDGLTLNSGCTNNFTFAPLNTNSLVNVTTSGGLTINGGAVNLYVTNSTTAFTTPGTYNLFKYAGTLGGAAANLTVANPQPSATYSFGTAGGYVQVTITASSGTYFWNVDASASWNNTADWTTTTIPNAAGVSANFGGGGTPITAPRTVTLDVSPTVGSLVFNSAKSFTINPGSPAGTITLDNSGATPMITDTLGSHTNTAPISLNASVNISVNTSQLLALNGAISDGGNGPVGLTNSGGGILTLGAANTYSGGTTLATSTVNLNNAAALGATASTLTINNGVTLDNTSGSPITLANNNAQIWNNGFTFKGTTNLDLGAGAVTLASTLTLTVTTNTLTVDGVISAPSGTNYNLLKAGGGQLILTASSTMATLNCTAGTLTLNAPGGVVASTSTLAANGGTINMAQSDTIDTLSSGGTSVVSGSGTLTVNTSISPNIPINQTNQFNSVLAGTAQLKKTGQGETILSGNNSYSGGTWITGANSKLFVTGSGTLGSTSGTLLIDTAGDILDLGGTSQNVGAVTLTSGTIQNGTLTGTSYSCAQGTISANLGDNGGSALTMNGTGANVLTLSGTANAYTGATTVNGGTLLVNGSLASGSAVAVNGGTLGGNGTINGSVTEASGANIAPGSSLTNVGIMTIVGNLTLSGGGSLTIAATNTSDCGEIIVGGSLNPSGTTTIVLPNTATLPNGNYTLLQVNGTLGGNAGNFSVASASPKTYTIVYQPGSPNKVILQVTGASTLTWTGDGSANQWNTIGSVDWTQGGVPSGFNNGDYVTFDNTSTNLNVNISTAVQPGSVTVNSTNNYSFAGVNGIGGATALVKSGSGTLTLATANTYTGATTVNSNSILVTSADNNLGAAPGSFTAGQLVLNGGTLSNTASYTLSANRGIAVGSPVSAGIGKIGVAANQTVTYASVIADNTGGAGTLIVNSFGTGTNILSGANTYTGGTILTNGTLTLLNDQSAANGGFLIGPNATPACTLNIASGANVAVAGAGTFQIGNTGGSGTSTITVNDAGTNNISGTLYVGRGANLNLNSGAVWTQSGNMTVQGAGNYPAIANINAGSTFTYTGSGTIKVNTGVNGNPVGKTYLNIFGTFITGQGFETTVSDTNGALPYVVINGGTLRLSASAPNMFLTTAPAVNAIIPILTGAATIDTDVYEAEITNAITGTGSLTKLGTGVLTNAGANTYTGNTTVGGGTLAIEQPTLATNSTVTVSNGCVLQLDFAVTNTVGALVLNGVSKAAGVYNHGTDPTYLTGTGSLLVQSSMASTPTNISYTINGSTLTLTWPQSYLGWYMQSNSVNVAITNYWFDIPGSTSVTNLVIPINPTQTNVFYRMRK